MTGGEPQEHIGDLGRSESGGCEDDPKEQASPVNPGFLEGRARTERGQSNSPVRSDCSETRNGDSREGGERSLSESENELPCTQSLVMEPPPTFRSSHLAPI